MRQGADLLTINSLKENDIILELIKNSTDNYWIGITDSETEGIFKWISTNSTKPSFRRWGPGEPNDLHGSEDCVELRKSKYFKWNDIGCLFYNRFICEKGGEGSSSLFTLYRL